MHFPAYLASVGERLSVGVTIIAIVGLSTASAHAQTFAPTKLRLAGKDKETQKDSVALTTKEVAMAKGNDSKPVIAKDPVQVITKQTTPAKIKEPEVITKEPVPVVAKRTTPAKAKEPEVVTKEPAKTIKPEPTKSIAKQKAMEPVRPITHYTYQTPEGKRESAPVITNYYPKQIVHPFAKIDRHLDPKLMRAATIAQERAHAHSRSMCWHYVKEALLASGVIDSRPKSEYAKDAAKDLVSNYGFKKLPVNDPFAAPVGSVLVYGSRRAAGHVELRTKDGFVSDFRSSTPSRRPLIGVYAKL